MQQNSLAEIYPLTYLNFQFLEASRETVKKRFRLAHSEFYESLPNIDDLTFNGVAILPHNTPHLARSICAAISGNFIPFTMRCQYFSAVSYNRINKPMRYKETQNYTETNPQPDVFEFEIDWEQQNQLYCELLTQFLIGSYHL